MTKSFWIAVFAYLLPTFLLGYCWHLVTFHDAYAALDLYRTEVIIPIGLGSMIIQALFFAWAYPRLFSTRRDRFLKSAALATLTWAILAWSFTTLPVAAKYNMASVSQFVLLESAFTLLQFAIAAPLIAWAWRDRIPASAREARTTTSLPSA